MPGQNDLLFGVQMMLVVRRVLDRGWFRDSVLLSATKNVSLMRKRLGWDALQAPMVKFEELNAFQGEEFVVSLPRRSVAEGQSFSSEEVESNSAFNRLWKRVEV